MFDGFTAEYGFVAYGAKERQRSTRTWLLAEDKWVVKAPRYEFVAYPPSDPKASSWNTDQSLHLTIQNQQQDGTPLAFFLYAGFDKLTLVDCKNDDTADNSFMGVKINLKEQSITVVDVRAHTARTYAFAECGLDKVQSKAGANGEQAWRFEPFPFDLQPSTWTPESMAYRQNYFIYRAFTF